ncbi:glycosyltransferase family 9 protein [Granulicella rosea]|uniref:glycosyltransferase family 9 protein n=1 Tax=Granulicella rosea TaxID=474952 RepID=UPI000B77BB08|nr:glycosyltransferase family 9 protein [Granulicella rosea]
MSKTVRRVLIYRLGSLGDQVVALPSLHLVRRSFPQAGLCMLTNFPVSGKAPAAAAILDPELIQGYVRYVVGLRNPLELVRLWAAIRRLRPDVVVYLAGARGVKVAKRDAWFFRLCGVRRLIGVPDTEDLQQNRLLDGGGRYESEAARLARTLESLGDARLESPRSWDLWLGDGERERAGQALEPAGGRPVIAVSIGTKQQTNDWGAERWRALLGRLGALLPGYALVLNGAADEREASDAIAEGWRGANSGPVLNLCGQLTPRESAAAFAQARVFVGHDSGPMHLAAAVQTPCVAIFSARQKPGVWFPHGAQHRVIYHQTDCWNCGLTVCVAEGKRCIYSIAVDEVVGAVLGALGMGGLVAVDGMGATGATAATEADPLRG